MNGIVARRNNFAEPILQFLEDAYEKFAELTGRRYGLISKYKTDDTGHGVRFPQIGRREYRSGC